MQRERERVRERTIESESKREILLFFLQWLLCFVEQDLSRGFKRDFIRVNMAVVTEREKYDGHFRRFKRGKRGEINKSNMQ